jgi:glutamyl-tRNA reductase
MNIFCVGINHRTAPIDIRERLWFSNEETTSALQSLKNLVREAVLVSTCNRTELYYVPQSPGFEGNEPWQVLSKFKKTDGSVQQEHFYQLESVYAVKHIYTVASGIDSMVLGDVQILSQMKDAFTLAHECGTTNILLHRLFDTAFHVGKRARTETEIAEGAVSISYAAAELASKIFEDLSRRTALLIGAGETGKLTAKHLTGRTLGNLLIANRTRKRAEELAGHLGGSVIDFENIARELSQVDIIISSVESPAFVLSHNDIRQAMKQRGNKPLFIIDIGVPRNIDPKVNTIENVFLHDIDALNHIVDKNLSHRREQVPSIQKIVLEELNGFKQWHDALDVTPTIQQLRERFEDIRAQELSKHLHHFPAESREEVELLTKRIINKILHTPMVNLRTGSTELPENDTRTKVFILRHLFGLDKKNQA